MGTQTFWENFLAKVNVMRRSCRTVLLLLFCGWMVSVGNSEVVTWNNTSTASGQLWGTASNWSPAQVPAEGDAVTIANGGMVDLGTAGGTYNGNVALSSGSIVADNPGGDVFYVMPESLTMTGGTVDLNVKRFLLGTSGTTTSTISGGTFTYKHDGGLDNNGSMRVGVIWDGATQTTDNVNATLNVVGNGTAFNVDRLVVGNKINAVSASVTAAVVIGDSAKATLKNNVGDQNALLIGHNATGSVTVKDSASLTVGGTIVLGMSSGSGTFTLQDSGTLTANNLTISSIGTYNQTGGTATIQNWSFSEGGVFSQTGGTATLQTSGRNSASSISVSGENTLFEVTAATGIFSIGGAAPTDKTNLSSYANFTLNSGQAKFSDQLYVANAQAYGKLIVNGGNLSATYLQLSSGVGYLGEMEVHGGEVAISNSIRLGRNGSAHLVMDGGKITTPNFYIGGFDASGINSDSSMTFSGGEVSVGSTLYVGGSGKGTLKMSGGTLSVKEIQVGRDATSQGVLELSGGKGDVTNLYLGINTGSTGSFNMSNGELKLYNLYVGHTGTGTWNMTGGTLSTDYLCVGYASGSSGDFDISSGDVTVTQNFRVGLNSTGNGTVSGGSFDINNLYIQGAGGGRSSLTIVGNQSTWKAKTFSMVSQSDLNFIFGNGGFSTIASGNVTLSGYATISTAMEVEGIQALKSKTFDLVTASGTWSNNGVNLVDSRYWNVSVEGTKVVATLQNYFTDLPVESVTEGVLQLAEASDSLLFYSDIFDPTTMDAFTDWLVESSDDVTSATSGELGSVLLQFAEAIDLFAFNFGAFNLLYPDNPAGFRGSANVPEPATWGMLLLGMVGVGCFLARQKRNCCPLRK